MCTSSCLVWKFFRICAVNTGSSNDDRLCLPCVWPRTKPQEDSIEQKDTTLLALSYSRRQSYTNDTTKQCIIAKCD